MIDLLRKSARTVMGNTAPASMVIARDAAWDDAAAEVLERYDEAGMAGLEALADMAMRYVDSTPRVPAIKLIFDPMLKRRHQLHSLRVLLTLRQRILLESGRGGGKAPGRDLLPRILTCCSERILWFDANANALSRMAAQALERARESRDAEEDA